MAATVRAGAVPGEAFRMRLCRFGAAGTVVPSSVVHGGVLVRACGAAARSVGDIGRTLQFTRVPGVGNAEARAGDCVGDGLQGFSSGTNRHNTAALSVARASRALQVAERILRARIARQRVPRGNAGSSDGISLPGVPKSSKRSS